jgi:hypothetical protein
MADECQQRNLEFSFRRHSMCDENAAAPGSQIAPSV